jgi:glucose dehydrogenase
MPRKSEKTQSTRARLAIWQSKQRKGELSMKRILITAMLAAAATTAYAQTATPEQKAKAEAAAAQMAAADANKDGKWDKAEWKAAGRRPMGFDKVDTNKDGYVSKDEIKAAAAARAGQ